MEMTTSGGAACMVPKPVEPCRWPAGWMKKKMWHQALLVGSLSLMTLLLLAFFPSLLRRGSTSSPASWLQMGRVKTSMNNGTAGLTTKTPHDHDHDELLGGLLPAGIDWHSCQSRYESWRYYKHFPYAASPHLQRKLRDYEARHRRCAPGTPLYARSVEQLRSGRSADGMECTYIVWLPMEQGLGNVMRSMVSAFMYALLTDRVFLVALPPDCADLFCEPFPGTTWRLPVDDDFPIANLIPRSDDFEHPHIGKSYTRLLHAKVIGPHANATAGVPPYVYLSLTTHLEDKLFFCGEHQLVLAKVNWLLQFSQHYFVPSLYAVAEFQDEIRRLFPAKESVSHLLSRYLFHPTNPVWKMVTRYYRSYLAPAKRRIGVQVRMFDYGRIPADDMYNQILSCSRQEHILPEVDDDNDDGAGGAGDEAAAKRSGDYGSNSTAILVASLHAHYYERLKSRYYEHAAKGGETVAVFQPSHEEWQAMNNLAHNQRALAEIYLLSFCEELLTSGRSTFGYISSSLAGVRSTMLLTAFGHKVPKPPCRRSVSMEPCNFIRPRGLQCQGKTVDKEDLARHLRACEDGNDSVKFFD